jgi:choline dehydrogenase-like flavoprotein
VRPAIAKDNITLLTEAEVLRLHTSPSGREVTSVEVKLDDQILNFSGDIVVVACGAINSADWFVTAEDLPDRNNRVTVKNGTVHLSYTENNTVAFDRLMDRWTQVLKSINCGDRILPLSLYFRKKLAIAAVAHQNGTCRFGADPKDSVLDVNCRAHDVDNLYVVDGSFFLSSAAVNPTLTIIANALRVGDHLLERIA